PQMLGQGRDDRVLAAETLLHEDAAELAAPLLLVPERALELVLVDDAQLGEQLSESLARRHRSPSLPLHPREVFVAREDALFDEQLDHCLQRGHRPALRLLHAAEDLDRALA